MVNLNELIREMTALLRDAANRHSISMRADLDESLPTIAADRVQMQQVLMNLMLNGIEAMRDTSGELTVRSGKSDDGQILLSVSDSGVGLPAEKIDQVFDAFFTTKTQGTGMGLSISRRIIESHGGRLWACANTGRGATFRYDPDGSECVLNFRRRRRSLAQLGIEIRDQTLEVQIDESYGKVVFLVVAALLTSLSLQAQWKTRWEYEGAKGPDHWTELDPAYASCNAGMAQSPIDIEASEKAALPALRFESRSGPLKYIVNNGYTIRVNYHDAAGTGIF